MKQLTLTPDQNNAVYARGGSLLVSAAAGSGKTRVLTERLMAYVTEQENPQDITAFLVITYTRAAAAELRARILDALSQRSAQEPENRRLRRQATLCYKAQIGTIHSFCTAILREYCHRLGLTPDFRVADEELCAELREKALEKALEHAYTRIDTDPDFAALVESVGAGRDDSRLVSTVLELDAKLQSHPYPDLWAEAQRRALDVSRLKDAGETIWGRELMQGAAQTARYWAERLETLWAALSDNSAENARILAAYGESLGATMDALRGFLHALDRGWDTACAALPIPFPRLKPLKNYDYEERKDTLLKAREGCKKAAEALALQFGAHSEKLLADLAATAPALRALLALTLDFNKLYGEEKSRRSLLDFSDLEHYAVRLLCDRDSAAPTETALEISRRYAEILIDEYQDVNAVQELIFRCISRAGNNLFMVGDVKQSIYRFRLADPAIFLAKYRDYKQFVSFEDTEPCKILLQRNFRSDKIILDVCNHVFTNLMSETLGELSYDSQAALFPPEDAPPPRGRAELTLVAVPQAEDGQERPDKTYLEAKEVARQIRRLVDGGETILDNGVERPIGYGDIAILLRSPNAAGAPFRRALAEAGIPLLAEQGGAFFSSPEILIILALLSVIDNPHRDVPLAAVLASPLFGFTADELSLIRAGERQGDFYTALLRAAETNEKSAAFLATLGELRALSEAIGVYALICLVYDRLSLYALCAAMDGATRDGVNLMLLLDCAARFEENGYRGLFAFLHQLKRMEARGEEPSAAGGPSGSAVSLMSIHKSKGLEFPVVFLANTAREFNKMDLRAPVLIHPRLGLGCKRTDLNRGLEYPTLARRAIAAQLSSELLSEEMRVLYVAMTRAREQLYISCAAREPATLLNKLSENVSAPMSPEILKNLPSPAHWLLSAALIENDGLLTLRSVSGASPEEPVPAPDKADEPLPALPDEGALAALRELFAFRYPYQSAVQLPSKLTATSLPQDEPDTDGEALAAKRGVLFRLPDLMDGERPLTGAERGTATHIVMQFIDFTRTGTAEDLEVEVSRLRSLGLLSERQTKAVDRGAIVRFFASELGIRIRTAERVHREKRFSVLAPAGAFFSQGGNESVLLQGVVDCCIEEDDALTILDYKTDYVTTETLDAFTAQYRRQILAYAYAMSRIFEKPVRSCVLCFLRAGLISEIRPEA